MFRTPMFVLMLAFAAASNAEVVLDDRFDDPASGWPDAGATRDQDVGFAVYANGKYQMTPVKNRAYGVIRAPRQAKGGDVKVTSAFFLYAGLGAGGGGLVCRMQDLENFYAFIVVGSGEWRIARIERGTASVLAQGSAGEQVMPGAVDAEMTAACEGDRLTLSLAGRRVGEVRDTKFAGGDAGLFVIGEEAAGTSISFDRVRIETP
jgi:hypothetical protein